MARTKAPSNLLGLVDSDSEDDLGGFKSKTTIAKPTAKPAPKATATKAMPAAKRGRPAAGAAAANKVTKPAQKKAAAKPRAGTKASAAAAAALKAAEAAENDDDDNNEADTTASTTNSRGRPALADRTNEFADADPEPAPAPEPKEKAKPRGRPGRKPAAAAAAVETDDSVMEEAPAAVAPKKRGRGRPRVTDENIEISDAVVATKPAKRGRAAAVAEKTEDVTMEEEDDEPQEDATAEPADETEIETAATTDKTAHNSTHQSPLRRTKSQLSAASPVRPRGTTSADDASTRRRLGELTKKYDALEAQYRNLKEIGIKEAERNFDRLKKQNEERTKTSDDLIASLKEELATYRGLAKDGAKAQRELEASEARAVDLKAQIAKLDTALGNAKAESKTLSTKLAAARTTAEAALPVGVVPGSAMKTSTVGKSSAVPTAANARAAVEAMHASTALAQLKEDLYGDLTGLLVRSAKRDGSREMYDCIQTGRNGSLHFKLCIDDEASSDGEDAQFVYTPQLDPSRDADLIEMLPDYLVEEISFPRMQAAKFYKRVMQSLTEEL